MGPASRSVGRSRNWKPPHVVEAACGSWLKDWCPGNGPVVSPCVLLPGASLGTYFGPTAIWNLRRFGGDDVLLQGPAATVHAESQFM